MANKTGSGADFIIEYNDFFNRFTDDFWGIQETLLTQKLDQDTRRNILGYLQEYYEALLVNEQANNIKEDKLFRKFCKNLIEASKLYQEIHRTRTNYPKEKQLGVYDETENAPPEEKSKANTSSNLLIQLNSKLKHNNLENIMDGVIFSSYACEKILKEMEQDHKKLHKPFDSFLNNIEKILEKSGIRITSTKPVDSYTDDMLTKEQQFIFNLLLNIPEIRKIENITPNSAAAFQKRIQRARKQD
tara:strand:- start:1881 stop:2615 length:735 start_codon:yes stop_codon:yes gene_type:complete